MTVDRCQQCPHMSVRGVSLYCDLRDQPIADVKRCGPKLIKAALKRRTLAAKKNKLKGKTV
jgi:hypothetical protein